MAAGDYQIVVVNLIFTRGTAIVSYQATWNQQILDGSLNPVLIRSGVLSGQIGTLAQWRALTGAQMESQLLAAITAAQASGAVPQGTVS